MRRYWFCCTSSRVGDLHRHLGGGDGHLAAAGGGERPLGLNGLQWWALYALRGAPGSAARSRDGTASVAAHRHLRAVLRYGADHPWRQGKGTPSGERPGQLRYCYQRRHPRGPTARKQAPWLQARERSGMAAPVPRLTLFNQPRRRGVLRSSTPGEKARNCVGSPDPQRTRKHSPTTASASIIPCPGTLSRTTLRFRRGLRRSLPLPAIHDYRVAERRQPDRDDEDVDDDGQTPANPHSLQEGLHVGDEDDARHCRAEDAGRQDTDDVGCHRRGYDAA